MNGLQCDHNINYWHNGPYLGIGPSAVRRVAGRRFGNARSLTKGKRGLSLGDGPSWSERLSPLARLGETWWLGLRLSGGLSPAEARERAEGGLGPEDDPFPAVADGLCEQGVLERRGDRYRLSARGVALADAVGREFLRESAPTLG